MNGPCTYEVNTGLLVFQPLHPADFAQRVALPTLAGRMHSSDGTDQGIINTLIYKERLFGDAYMRLHPMYNVIARHAKHTGVSHALGTES